MSALNTDSSDIKFCNITSSHKLLCVQSVLSDFTFKNYSELSLLFNRAVFNPATTAVTN